MEVVEGSWGWDVSADEGESSEYGRTCQCSDVCEV